MQNGHVWESAWRPLVDTIFKGFPSSERRYKPTAMGYVFLEGLKQPLQKLVDEGYGKDVKLDFEKNTWEMRAYKEQNKKHLEHLLNLLTYDDLAEDEKIDACVEYIRDTLTKT